MATMVLAGISYFFIVDWPENARFLNNFERKVVLARLRAEKVADVTTMDHLDKSAIKRILGDIKVWLGYVLSALISPKIS